MGIFTMGARVCVHVCVYTFKFCLRKFQIYAKEQRI